MRMLDHHQKWSYSPLTEGRIWSKFIIQHFWTQCSLDEQQKQLVWDLRRRVWNILPWQWRQWMHCRAANSHQTVGPYTTTENLHIDSQFWNLSARWWRITDMRYEKNIFMTLIISTWSGNLVILAACKRPSRPCIRRLAPRLLVLALCLVKGVQQECSLSSFPFAVNNDFLVQWVPEFVGYSGFEIVG